MEPAAATTLARRVSIEDFTDEEAQLLCTQMYQRQQQRERDKKDAEPIDAAWAPSMEMLIRQHVESILTHKQYSQLDIECHTTFCELKLAGTGSANMQLAQKIAQEIAQEPWGNSIVNRGSSANGRGGDAWEVTQEWFRPRTEAELRMWRGAKQNQQGHL
jgi:hypothetical protein